MIKLIITTLAIILVCMPIIFALFMDRSIDKLINELRNKMDKWDIDEKIKSK